MYVHCMYVSFLTYFVHENSDSDKGNYVVTILADLKKEGGEVKTGGCEHCHKPNPTKRCSKRHPKCMKFMFCNEVCEKIVCQKVHQKKKAVPPPTTDQTGKFSCTA